MKIHPHKIDTTLSMFSALSDKTRLEIVSLLLKNPEGMTASDIARIIGKKIPSTIYQLQILKDSNLINDEMKVVSSIGREIKHWSIPRIRNRIIIDFSLPALCQANNLSYSERKAFIESEIREISMNKRITLSDLELIVDRYNQDQEEKMKEQQSKMKSKKNFTPNFILSLDGVIDTLAMKIIEDMMLASLPEIARSEFTDMYNFDRDVGALVIENLDDNGRIDHTYENQTVYRFLV